MRTRSVAWAMSLTLVAGVALAPVPALAQRAGGGFSGGGRVSGGARVGGGGRVVVGQPIGSRPVAGHHRFAPDSFGRRPFFNRGFAPFGGIVYAPGLYGAPWYYGSAPYYDPAPMYYAPPVYSPPLYAPPGDGTISLAPTAPPMPSVVEFPTGRYELRGDGVTAPYRWVWIPNPPSAPPVAPPPPAPSAPPSSSDPGPARRTTVYRWTDEEGTTHLTDRLDTVPERYRAQAKRNASS